MVMFGFCQAEGRVMGRWLVLTLVIGMSAGFLTSSELSRNVNLSSYRAAMYDFKRRPLIAEHTLKPDNHSVADELARKVRVLCWVMTQPKNHWTRAVHVKATWGKRCNKLIFMSTEKAVKLPVHEGYDFLWGKTKAAFRYVYEHHRRDADWFLKADDDTFVIVENLRYMLSKYNPKNPNYFGYRFDRVTKQGYMSGGAGYVLSRAALDRFVNDGLPSPHLCKADDHGIEDVEMGICLDRIGVKAMYSRDKLKLEHFFPTTPLEHLFPEQDSNYKSFSCCSDHAVSFHYIRPNQMYLLQYLIYRLRPYGISYGIAGQF